MENKFLSAVNNVTHTENGALSNKSTFSSIVDQFGVAGTYRGRELFEVFKDQETIYEENALMSLIFPFYLRAITRKTKSINGHQYEDVVKGQGARDEAFKRLLWFAVYHSATFYENIALLPIVGSWKDVITLAYYANKYDVDIESNKFFELLKIGLSCKTHTDLVKKYIPRIISNKKCTTDWTRFRNHFAKDFAKYLGLKEASYNKMKSDGNGHVFQKLISQKKFKDIKWNSIPGKALLLLTSGKFLSNNNLVDAFESWMKTREDIKFNGYPYELGNALDKYYAEHSCNRITPLLVDLQYNSLIKTGKECGSINGNVWCALDTSGSMTHSVANSTTTAYNVCISLGIYFSELNKGAFHNNVVMFDNVSQTLELKGTFSEKWNQIQRTSTAWGSTNFQSIIDLLCRTRRNNENIPLEDYPTTILVVSDMEFDNVGSSKTNYEVAKDKLYDVFPRDYVNNLKFVWWDVDGRNKQYPSTLDDKNTFFFSGFDGAIVTELLGGKNAEKKDISTEDVITQAFSQEVFETLELVD